MTNARADLEFLIGQLAEARGVRLTARPGRVVIDHRDGTKALEVEWTEERHATALAAFGGGASEGGTSGAVIAKRVGDAIVVTRGPDANRRIDDVARDGTLSSLAGRFLDAALASGRNIVVAGPWLAAVDLVWALVAGGSRPAALDATDLPLPAGWMRAKEAWDLTSYGADRIAAWSRDVYDLGHLMSTTSGLVGWLDARRLDRVLVRYEAAIDSALPHAQSPLQVISGLDIVVVVRSSGSNTAPRVQELAEITMSADGYRPQLLFSTGLPPSPTALTPLAAPSFLDELAASGFGVLADELRAAVPRRSASVGHRHAEPEDIEEISPEAYARDNGPIPGGPRGVHRHDPLNIRDALPRNDMGRGDTGRGEFGPRGDTGRGDFAPRGDMSRGDMAHGGRPDPLSIRDALRATLAAPAPAAENVPRAVTEALRHAPPPGWELDQAGGEQFTAEAATASNAEDAAMAATFGLAPPPRPVGYKGETVSFTELLKRAKEREQTDVAEQLPLPPHDEP